MKVRSLLLFVLLPVMAGAQTYTYSTLVTFTAPSGPSDANFLISDAQGNLYGSSYYGGIYNTDSGGDGTVYKVTPAGVLTVLHSFGNGKDGQNPNGALTRDAKGNIYGTTFRGGAHGSGTIFKLSPSGTERLLYSFPSEGHNLLPTGGVTLDAAGNIYGYVYNYIGYYGDGGNIFQLTPQGVFSILYNWCTNQCSTLPNSPVGLLIPNPAGGFFGATSGGGGIGTPAGNVFSFSPQSGMQVLHTFSSPDGGEDTPVLDSAGNLFGIEGPVFQSGGGVYEISPDGTFSMLYTLPTSYGFQQSNGGTPILDSSGNLYNTTGTIDFAEIVYEVSPAGIGTVLFTGSSSQVSPTGVVMDKAGNLYGTGTSGRGLIYKLTRN